MNKFTDSQALAERIVALAEEKKAQDLVSLDLRGITLIADYFIIMSAANNRQAQAISDHIYETLKDGGHCDIVVSNSAYAGIIIPTDIFLAMIAEKIGFKVVRIDVERLIITSSQQYKKTEHLKKYLRESIVKLEK